MVIHAIFFAFDTNTDLKNLAEDSGGVWYFGGDEAINNILQAFRSLAEPQNGNKDAEVFQVCRVVCYTNCITIFRCIRPTYVFDFEKNLITNSNLLDRFNIVIRWLGTYLQPTFYGKQV